MGNCEKSMYHERQKERRERESQEHQTPQVSNEAHSNKESAN